MSKHLAAQKRLRKLSSVELVFNKVWEKAYKHTLPLLNIKQRRIAESASNNLLINMLITLNEWFLPGDHNHLLTRKYFIRKWLLAYQTVREVDHLVILGAGLDPLLYTLPELPKKITLVDHPDMIQDVECLYKSIHNDKSTVCFSYTDLNNKDKIGLFFDQIYDENSKFLFITEGVLDYLNPSNCSLIITQISNIMEQQQSHWIGTLFCLNEMNWLERLSFTKAIEIVGESIKWRYSLEDFKKLLTPTVRDNIAIYNHSDLLKNSSQKLEMNQNRMNGFYMFKC